jgi:hypothetical protein
VRWDEFRPTSEGQPVATYPLDLANIRRWSFMIRSFFGEQQGEFKLDIKSVAAFY